MPSDEDYKKLFDDYMLWVIDYSKHDPPDYIRAADVLLTFFQAHSSHPCVFYDYQLESLTHFIKSLHQRDIGFSGFRYVVERLVQAANEGLLRDTRIVNN